MAGTHTVVHPPDQLRCPAECWKYALKANQAHKQQVQQLHAPCPVATDVVHSPPRPTKISPNLSAVSSSTPLKTSHAKRCRWNDSETSESAKCLEPLAKTPRASLAPNSQSRKELAKGIDAAQRPEHDKDRQRNCAKSPRIQPVKQATQCAPPEPPSPESLEEGELRSP